VFREILTGEQQNLLELLSRIAEVRSFYLAGGTGLALHLGHRRSQDFDFFRSADFQPQDLLTRLMGLGEIAVLQEASRTLTVARHGIPVSFFHYDYPLLRPLQPTPWSIPIAHPVDIAAMKLAALSGRGSRKDFVDLYVYCRQGPPLEEVFTSFREKYRPLTVDPYHLLRSLVFFEDAEAEAMPDLLHDVPWADVKTFFKGEAARLFRTL
jgi:nucleotidyltransferase AbiEii toxin of type IV toxin-antitoxin system